MTLCACGDTATEICTHCHEANCIDCMHGFLCRDCDYDENPNGELER